MPPAGPPLFHDVVLDEDDGFRPHASVRYELPASEVVGLRLIEGALRVWVPNGFGAPRRPHRPEVFRPRGEWVRFQLNNRYSSLTGEAGWHYSLTTVSVGFGGLPATRSWALRTTSSMNVRLCADIR